MELLPELPTDIIVHEILPRLPATSLIRFKSVNKFFRTLISSRKFIDLHLHQCLSSNTNRFLILEDCSERRLYWLDLDSPITGMVKLPGQQSSADDYRTLFVGSCNGLICFVNSYFKFKRDHEVVIMNPCTGMIKSGIPTPIDGHRIRYFMSLGFGYDSVKDDYKFVGFDADFDDEINHYIIEIMVYSIRADSWHRCITKTYTKVYSCSGPGVLYNHHLIHWMIYDSSDDNEIAQIGCFNLETEQWTCYEVPIPQSQFFELLRVINGYIGLFTRDDIHYYLWIMKDYGVKESWHTFLIYEYYLLNNAKCMLYTVVNAYRRKTRKDELLVSIRRQKVSKDEEEHFWYDIKRQTYDRFKRIPPTFQVEASSIGSLVSIV